MSERNVSITVPAFVETLDIEVVDSSVGSSAKELFILKLSRSGARALVAMINAMLEAEDDCESMSLHCAVTMEDGVDD